ncbi:MAG: hypothetical protein EON91_10690 [Brevundimonas sp.]|uniref:LytTR family DNA-binding domain-containing protein n=1 Tax=Brevundimonas sp. TaxID=1871086 RepID=UPI0012008DD6|nr:LytTR family DNA-binding domain-containing protein [Brevundimonas sp.]RZJ17092.1 MAG: hypothetical protein EON91_10690 [Brevundimonas sp.]
MTGGEAPWRDAARTAAVAVAIGGFLALAGAFGSGGASLTARLAYWIPMMLLGSVWGLASARLLERFVDLDDRPWLQVAALTLLISGPLSVIVWAVTGLVFTGRVYPLEALPQLIAPVTVVTLAVSAVNVFVSPKRTIQTHAPAAGPAVVRFLDRLPPRLRGARLIAVQAEDHYLRLHTDRGSDLILMRLSDALQELEGLEGAQTHRSWWVARDAVRAVERGDGRAMLTLDSGLTAPVSRRHARALRDAGWY